jgi:hypothetical protein
MPIILPPKPPPGPTPPQKPTKPPTAQDFIKWVGGRTGLTWREFFDAWAGAYDLTTEEREALWSQVKDKEPKPPKPPPEKPPEKPKPKEPVEKPGLVIERTPYPKWWKDSRAWPININAAGTWPIIPTTPGYRTYIATIVFTVSDETNITFNIGVYGPTGPMDFGGESEPRGIVMAMADSPIPCGDRGFSITSDGEDVLVSGFIVYYYEKE